MPKATRSVQEIIRRRVPSDTPFRSRIRTHQAWWRDDQGYGFGKDRNGDLGSLLSDVDAAAGHNFLTQEIHQLAKRSIGRHVEKRRLMGNLLSSQPMAFNLFGPISLDPKLSRALLEPMLKDSIFSATIEIEFTPHDKLKHLNDETSFDALIRYTKSSGQSGIVAIETKLSEPFSPVTANTHADRDIYREASVASELFLDPYSAKLATSNCWQMWRNHLLAFKFVRNHCPPGTEFSLWVIRHQDDQSGASSIDAYRKTLANPSASFQEWTLAEIVSLWERHIPIKYKPWLQSFYNRYVDLSQSDHLILNK